MNTQNTNSASQHSRITVVGAGQIGTPLVAKLAREGHSVVWVSRTKPAHVPDGATHVSVDVRDGRALAAAAAGSRAIIAAVNPSVYDIDVWQRELPPLHAGLIDAAERSGARLVVLDALYLYAIDRGPLSPETPEEPATKKGAVRKALADALFAAHREGRIRATTLRASDFWGPGLSAALASSEVVEGIAAGKRPIVMGDPDAKHAFSHRDDVVDGLARLAFAEDDVHGRAFHAPVIHATPRELVHAIARASGTQVEPRVAPRWLLRVLGIFSPAMRGMIEMLPQWESPYFVDDSGYRARFGVEATSLEAGARAMAPVRKTSVARQLAA